MSLPVQFLGSVVALSESRKMFENTDAYPVRTARFGAQLTVQKLRMHARKIVTLSLPSSLK